MKLQKESWCKKCMHAEVLNIRKYADKDHPSSFEKKNWYYLEIIELRRIWRNLLGKYDAIAPNGSRFPGKASSDWNP